jgi:electron transfer flavoprotein beta subunit
MHIVVCIKQIIDPEIPTEQFKLDPASKRQVRGGLSLVISAYDQNAVEVALQLREKAGGTITVLSVGAPEAQGAIKSAMGMGADAGVLVTDPTFAGSDSFGVAHILAQAVRKIGNPDLILTGCVSGDTGNKMIGPLLAEELGLPCLSFVSRLEVTDRMVVARRIMEDGYERVEGPLPLVASILSDDGNVPRYSKLKDIMAAARKTVPVWNAADLGVAAAKVGATGRRLDLRDVTVPHRESRCEVVGGETPAEQAERLALRLRELKVI